MTQERVPLEIALLRLSQHPFLSCWLGDQWLEQQYKKSVEQYSLIAGWLTALQDDWEWTYRKYVASLDQAIEFLDGRVSDSIKKKLKAKIKAESDRAETKGTLAEISLAVFLVQAKISFDMETTLVARSRKNVDFSFRPPVLQQASDAKIHVDCHWLDQSDKSKRTDMVSAQWRCPVSTDFEAEKERILGKIYDKTGKFTRNAITLVALDCTANPDLGKLEIFFPNALEHIFNNKCGHQLSERDSAIRDLVDGVLWFRDDTSDRWYPIDRGFMLNPCSDYYSFLLENMTWWSSGLP
jgi:hypothetical protein